MRIRLTDKIMNDDHDDAAAVAAAAVHDEKQTKAISVVINRYAIAPTQTGNLQTCRRLESRIPEAPLKAVHPR